MEVDAVVEPDHERSLPVVAGIQQPLDPPGEDPHLLAGGGYSFLDVGEGTHLDQVYRQDVRNR